MGLLKQNLQIGDIMQRSKLRLFDHLVGERDVLGLIWAGLAPADRASFA
jgi:hypothetical protein